MLPLFLDSRQVIRQLLRWGFIVSLLAFATAFFIPASFAAPNDLTLTLLSSSEADVSGNPNNVLIGEVMTYQLVYEVPEGTSTNVVITANLPAGLQYVPTATATVASNNGWAAPMTVTGGASPGAAVSFNFGTISNTDVDANAETITIQFKAIANNVVGNQSGTTLSVNGQLRINSVLTTTSGSVTVTIIEPNLSILSYTITSPTGLMATAYPATAAGDTYNYRISFTNSGNAPAYNLILSIILPLSYVFETTATYTISGAPTCGSASLSGIDPVIVSIPCLNPGATLNVQVNVTVNGTVQPLDSWLSSASLTNYTSLPDENGSNDDVPGTYGTATGARTGADGSGGALNNYATPVTNSPTVSVPEVFVAFDSATSSAAEASGIGNVLRITTASGSATSAAVTVTISVAGGSATAGDYTLGGTITIPSGTASNSLFPVASGFSVNNDTIVEPDETVSLQLSAPSGNAALGAQTTHTHTIQNDDTTTLTISDNVIVEGNAGTSTLNLTVSSSAAVQGGFTVAYSLTDGTATIANNDYAATGSSLTFTGTAGETRTIPVTINGDRNIEANETFTAAFGAISGTTIGQASFVRSDIGTGTINNDDTAGITITPTTIAIAEGGATATFDVAAQANPVNPVSIPVTTDGECTVSVNPVVLAAGNVTPVTVTVTAVDDLDIEGTHTCMITLGDPTSADANFDAITDVADVTATVTDNDTAVITVTPTTIAIAEGGASATFSLASSTNTVANVDILVTTDGQCLLSSTANPSPSTTLTVTLPVGSGTAIIVTVEAVDDNFDEGAHTCVITTGDPNSADANYDNLNAVDVADVIADVTDNDTAGITLSTIAVTEGVAGVDMDVVLLSEPTGDVTITITPDAQCALSTNTLTFTGSAGAAPWNTTQPVTVTAVDDAVAEGAHTCVISYTAASSDANFTVAATNHNVAVTDNDSAGITLSTITIIEGAAGVATDVVLLSDPTGDVTITFTPDAQCTLNPTPLTFTDSAGAAPWNIAQQVTVTAVDDAVGEGAHTCVITYSASSSDANYAIAATNHIVDVVDNDTPGIFLATVTIVEGGAGVSMDVRLFTQPTGDVTITLTPDAQCTLNPTTLTFTDSAGATPWSIVQQVMVTAVDDLFVEASQHDCALSVSSTSADANYNGLTVAHPVTVHDNDSEPAPAVPAETFLCGNLRQQTNGAMTGSGDIGNVELNGVYGNTYCSVLALNREFLRNPAEIGNTFILEQGVVQALDVYGLLSAGVSVVPFQTPVQICFTGSGSVYFLSSFGGDPPPIQLPQLASSPAGYTCVSVPNAGKVVLVSTPSTLQPQPLPPAQTTSTILASGACQVTTTFAVRLRATPDVSSDTNVIATLPFDLTLAATEHVPGWYRVIYQNGQGWVSDQYLTTRGTC